MGPAISPHLTARIGELRHIDAKPSHALAAKLKLTCARGKARGTLILTGEQTPRIQSLTLEARRGRFVKAIVRGSAR